MSSTRWVEVEVASEKFLARCTGMLRDLEARWVRAVRPLLRAYPFGRGRARLSSLLLGGSFTGPYPGPPKSIVHAIPDGAVIRCRHGLKLRLHRDEGFIWPFLFGEYEEKNTQIYSALISPGDTVFDIGASYGWYSALFGKLVGDAGSVHAFEPVPEFADLAADTLALNDLGSVVQFNTLALGRETGSLVIYTFAELPLGHASSSSLGRHDASSHECLVTTIDEYVAQRCIEHIDFLKVDVEGDERDAFLGGEATLCGSEGPIIAFEVNLDCLLVRGLVPEDVQEPLLAFGYDHFWAIHPEGSPEAIVGPLPTGRTRDYVAAKGRAVQVVEEAVFSGSTMVERSPFQRWG